MSEAPTRRPSVIARWLLGAGSLALACSIWVGPTLEVRNDDTHAACGAAVEAPIPRNVRAEVLPEVDVDVLAREVRCSWPTVDGRNRYEVTIDRATLRQTLTTGVFALIGATLLAAVARPVSPRKATDARH